MRFLNTRFAESGPLEVGLVEERSLQVSPVQKGVFQVGLVEVSPLQVRLAQIGSREKNCRGSALFFSRLVPLFVGEAAEQARQWKGMQVCITQVRGPQVQALAISLLVAGRSGITFTFECYQDPLDIGTVQFHPPEGIDASRDVGDRRKTARQLFLARRANLGFST